MKEDKLLVIGANGRLGNEIRIVTKNSRDHYIFTDMVEVEGQSQKIAILDNTKLEAIRKLVPDYDVKVIVNCAAYSNVDAADRVFAVGSILQR